MTGNTLTRLTDGFSDDVRGRLEQYAVLDTVERWAKAAKSDVRDRLTADLQTAEHTTGMAQTLRHPDGVGTVLRTAPTPAARVGDQDAWATWVAANLPDEVEWRRSYTVLDERAFTDAVHNWCSSFDAEDDHGCREAAWAMAEETKATRVPLVSDGLLGRLTAEGGRLAPAEAGVVDTVTGEVVPGLVVSSAAPSTQVRVDKAHRARLTAQLPAGDA